MTIQAAGVLTTSFDILWTNMEESLIQISFSLTTRNPIIYHSMHLFSLINGFPWRPLTFNIPATKYYQFRERYWYNMIISRNCSSRWSPVWIKWNEERKCKCSKFLLYPIFQINSNFRKSFNNSRRTLNNIYKNLIQLSQYFGPVRALSFYLRL